MQLEAHAYLCRGSAEDIPTILTMLGGAVPESTDLLVRTYEDLGIDDARDIRDRAALKGFGAERFFVVAAASITAEAQHALLKTIEEPGAGAQFLLIVPAPWTLLATLRSRMQQFDFKHAVEPASPLDVSSFLSTPPERRIDLLKPLTTADERDTSGMLAFLAAIERAIAADPTLRDAATSLYRARAYILDKGALRKSLLEQLALVIPRRP